MKKKIYKNLGALVLLLLASCYTFAQQFTVNGINYNTNGTNTVEVGDNSGISGDLIIPSSVTFESNTYTVTSIRSEAFFGCEGLSSISIPNTITDIQNSAFYGCYGLSSFSIPNSVINIEDYAFNSCFGLTSIIVDRSIPLVIPNNVFTDCYATLYVPSGSISSYQLADGWNVLSTIQENNQFSQNGILYTITSSTTVEVTRNTPSYTGAISIPSSVTYANSTYTVTGIGAQAFSGSNSLSSISIPSTVTSIGDNAFVECYALTNVTIPNSVTSIGINAFSKCTGLTSFSFPNLVTTIKKYTFYQCVNLTNINIPNSVTNIEEGAFYGCTGLISISVDWANPVNILQNVFYDAYDATLYVPNGTKSAYQNAVGWKNFSSILEPTITDIESINQLNYSIYPNPATDKVTLTFNELISGLISIFDLQGNLVYSDTLTENTVNLSTSELSRGVYLVKINSNKGAATKQLFIK